MKNQLPVIQENALLPEGGTHAQVAGDLCRESIFIEAETSNKHVFDIFDGHPGLQNIPVVSDGEVVGLINRDKFMRSMARRFHWEIYANKRCSKMMDGVPLTVEADTPISVLADQLLGERQDSYRLSDGFVIKRGRKLIGTGVTSDVLAAILSIQRLLAKQLVQANERLRELTITDPLTGLHNRRHFKEIFERELRRARRDLRPVGLIMLDIDCFKKLNDKLGHQAGDEALKQVAATLKEALRRPADYCFRIGGEEFAVLVSDTTAETLSFLAESLRGAVEALGLSNPDHPLGIVTISAGMALSAHRDADELFALADQALYQAKADGRNRVVMADPAAMAGDLPVAGVIHPVAATDSMT